MVYEIFDFFAIGVAVLPAFLQVNANEIFDIMSKFNTPLSVAIVLWFCKVIFSAWREDTQKARKDSQKFFDTLKELIASLEKERKFQLNSLTNRVDNPADSIRESDKKRVKNS